jgi:cytochrome c oxidase subunit IV
VIVDFWKLEGFMRWGDGVLLAFVAKLNLARNKFTRKKCKKYSF